MNWKDGLKASVFLLFVSLSLSMIWPQQDTAYPGDTVTFCFRQTYFGTNVLKDVVMNLYVKELNVSQEKYLSVVEPLQEETMCASFYFNSSGNFTICGSFVDEGECISFEVRSLPFNVSWEDGVLSVTFLAELENVTIQFGNESVFLPQTYPGLTLSRRADDVRIQFDHHIFERSFPKEGRFEFPYTIVILVILAFLLFKILFKR